MLTALISLCKCYSNMPIAIHAPTTHNEYIVQNVVIDSFSLNSADNGVITIWRSDNGQKIDAYLTVVECTFINCSSSSTAIIAVQDLKEGSKTTVDKTCAFECQATAGPHFTNAGCNFVINNTCLCLFGNETNSNQYMMSVNSSYTFLSSSVNCSSSKFKGFQLGCNIIEMKFYSFINNTGCCIENSNDNNNISFCNFIDNDESNNYLIKSNASFTVSNSYFKGSQNIGEASNGKTISFTDCCFDNITASFTGSCSTTNVQSMTQISIYYHPCYLTPQRTYDENCVADMKNNKLIRIRKIYA